MRYVRVDEHEDECENDFEQQEQVVAPRILRMKGGSGRVLSCHATRRDSISESS